MNRRNFITELGIGLLTATSLKSFGDINDNWVPVLMANTKNSNDRCYPLEVVLLIKRQIRNLIDKGQCFASLYQNIQDVPDEVCLKNISGQIDDVKFENNILYVKWHLLTTPTGQVVKNYGKDLYLTSAGIGNLIKGEVKNYEFVQFIISPTSSWEEHFKQSKLNLV